MEKKMDPCMQEDTENTKKKEKRNRYLKIIALALCCSLLGGILGGGIVFAIGNTFSQRELTETLENQLEYIIESHIRAKNPLLRRFGNTKEFIEEKILKETYIGISVSNASEPEGAMIETVEKGSPAAKASLQTGDIITMVNHVKIDSCNDLARIIGKADTGDELLFTVFRQDNTFDCTVTVGEHSRFGD